jgi:hypothetical protein
MSIPCLLYAAMNLEKYLAHGRCIRGSRPLGLAEAVIERLPSTGSFIHAGGDHGEAKRLSLRPRRATVS